jgi:hypothetical protein
METKNLKINLFKLESASYYYHKHKTSVIQPDFTYYFTEKDEQIRLAFDFTKNPVNDDELIATLYNAHLKLFRHRTTCYFTCMHLRERYTLMSLNVSITLHDPTNAENHPRRNYNSFLHGWDFDNSLMHHLALHTLAFMAEKDLNLIRSISVRISMRGKVRVTRNNKTKRLVTYLSNKKK